MIPVTQFYKNKRILITGHTGFKGSWLALWLHKLGADVHGIALPPYTQSDNFVLTDLAEKIQHTIADIRHRSRFYNLIQTIKPHIVFHLAAQPLVRYSYDHPLETFDTNVFGTINLLESLRLQNVDCTVVIITSDKCYKNKEKSTGYRESDELGGDDPYSASKGATEIICNSYLKSFFHTEDKSGIRLATARAGNVIGGGDWQKDRIIPDCIRSIESGVPISIRNPESIRPWQHVLDPLHGYMMLAAALHSDPETFGGAWNFGPDESSHRTVLDLINLFHATFGEGKWTTEKQRMSKHETGILKLDNKKAGSILGWHPEIDFRKSVDFTVKWYRNYKSCNMFHFAMEQIEDYYST